VPPAGGDRDSDLTEGDEIAVLLATVRELTEEMHPNAPLRSVGMDSLVDADLGLDSLALVEFRSRVEEVFGVTLPDRVLDEPTLAGWLDTVRAAPGSQPVMGRPRAVRRDSAVLMEDRVGWPEEAQTLVEALSLHVDAHPQRTHIRLLHTSEDEGASEVLTYGSVAEQAHFVAGGLHQRGLRPTERVAIMLPTGAEYFAAFLGVVIAGGVPVPIYPPARPAGLEDHLRRQVRILDNAGARFLVTVPEARLLARLLRSQVPSLEGIVTVEDLRGAGTSRPLGIAIPADAVALIQYTSGSTGNPKGVVLSHRQLLANIRAIVAAVSPVPDDVVASWLPLYHDMGLIGAWLTSLYLGLEFVVMPPTAFVARPIRWLRVFGDYGATLSPSPNFGYELCLRHVADDQLNELDLSTWRLALNGAEPVSPETVERFTERFARCGFRPEAMLPVYGLAEAGVALTFPPLGRRPDIDAVDRQILLRSGRARPAAPNDPLPLRVVSSGRPLVGYQVRVVDSAGEELSERLEGRVEFIGPSATLGYFHNEEATRALRRGDWVDTGDLGYIADGDLYLTGRSKDIIIRAGRNLHPDELEDAVGRLPDVRKGCVAAFASSGAGRGTERFVVLAESRLDDADSLDRLRQQITALTVDLMGTPPDEVVVAPPGTVLKTSSGKVRRSACRELYESGDVGRHRSRRRWQVVRFALTGVRPQARRTMRTVGSVLYAIYMWTAALVVGIPAWLCVMALPTTRLRWGILRGAGRVVCGLCGITLEVAGTVPERGPYVVAANHASFIDGLVLVLSLPMPVAFVAGGELAGQRVAGPFLRKLGCEFVDQEHPQQRSIDAARITTSIAAGRSFAFFPEGSVHRAPGLRPFLLGAFAAASSAAAPVVPVGIRGSRDIVRPGGRFPRRGAVRVALGDPIPPLGNDWAAVLALRDRTRTAILALSGEPELG
jgi:1-acyl-sn-glycerol-3-phosphate acyltransferase